MLLIFLLIFAFLALALVRQLERGHAAPELPVCHCPGCGQPVEQDWLLCPRCKELLQESCHICRQHIPVFHRFCTACGTSRAGAFAEFVHDDQV